MRLQSRGPRPPPRSSPRRLSATASDGLRLPTASDWRPGLCCHGWAGREQAPTDAKLCGGFRRLRVPPFPRRLGRLTVTADDHTHSFTIDVYWIASAWRPGVRQALSFGPIRWESSPSIAALTADPRHEQETDTWWSRRPAADPDPPGERPYQHTAVLDKGRRPSAVIARVALPAARCWCRCRSRLRWCGTRARTPPRPRRPTRPKRGLTARVFPLANSSRALGRLPRFCCKLPCRRRSANSGRRAGHAERVHRSSSRRDRATSPRRQRQHTVGDNTTVLTLVS